jgi:hypothetical protein
MLHCIPAHVQIVNIGEYRLYYGAIPVNLSLECRSSVYEVKLTTEVLYSKAPVGVDIPVFINVGKMHCNLMISCY